MSQPAFEGMPRRLYPAAPSRLTTYLDCPRRYRMAYLDRPTPPKGPPWGHNSVGAAVHTALARWWQLPRERRTPAAGGALLVEAWLGDGFRDRAQLLRARERARGQVERYLASVDPDHPPLAVERTVAVRTPRAALWGRVDRIDDRSRSDGGGGGGDGGDGGDGGGGGGDDGGVVVVDYKTGRSVLTVDDARSSLQLAVYAAATARTLHRACTRVELHHLPTGEVLAWEHTEESLAEQLRRADALAAQLADLDEAFEAGMSPRAGDEAFPARVGSRCGWCDFRPVCDPGRSVPQQRPWAGVAEAD